eukprot:10040757-Karenia_brevis.AAC.1
MVASVLLWGVENWNANHAILSRPESFYTGLVLRMLQWKKRLDMSIGDFIIARNSHARYLLSVTT